MHNKEYYLHFANGDSRKRCDGRCLLFMCGTDISQRSERLPDRTNRNGFFLIAQRHNVLFRNTNTFVQEYRRHACHLKEAVGETLCSQSAHVSAQTRSQLYQERTCVCVCVCVCVIIISCCCRAKSGPIAWSFLRLHAAACPPYGTPGARPIAN